MPFARPSADIASFPAPGWTPTPQFSVVNSVDPNDATFLTALAPGAQDPQIALALQDLEIPYGSSGRIELRVRMRWNQVLTVVPDTVRVGLADVADLGVTDPTLLFERSLVGTNIVSLTATGFETFEIIFDYEDFSGDGTAFGFYLEMTPNSADAAAVGHVSWVEVLSCVPAVLIEQCTLGGLTAGDVIKEARDLHMTFNDRAHPNGTLLRTLSNYQRHITSKIVQVNPDLLASEASVSLPLADFNAGILLPAYTYIMPALELQLAANTALKHPLPLKAASLRSVAELPNRFAYLRGNQLFLGRRPENYELYDQLQLQLVLTPRPLKRLSDPLMLPAFGVDAYVGHLGLRMAARTTPPVSLQIATTMESDFLTAVAQQKAARVSYTLDVWPGGM